jgi:hypothetical protein
MITHLVIFFAAVHGCDSLVMDDNTDVFICHTLLPSGVWLLWKHVAPLADLVRHPNQHLLFVMLIENFQVSIM